MHLDMSVMCMYVCVLGHSGSRHSVYFIVLAFPKELKLS